MPKKHVTTYDELVEVLKFIVNDVPEPGEDAVLGAEGYNRACQAIQQAKPRKRGK